jgi:hypothetical protein
VDDDAWDRAVTAYDGVFTEQSATPVVRKVALSHLSIELGHLYMDDFAAGRPRLQAQFRGRPAVGRRRPAGLRRRAGAAPAPGEHLFPDRRLLHPVQHAAPR